MPTELRFAVNLGDGDLNLIIEALYNRMTHHGRAEARLKTGGWHHVLCERYRALHTLFEDSVQVMVISEATALIPPEPVLPEPEPDPIEEESIDG